MRSAPYIVILPSTIKHRSVVHLACAAALTYGCFTETQVRGEGGSSPDSNSSNGGGTFDPEAEPRATGGEGGGSPSSGGGGMSSNDGAGGSGEPAEATGGAVTEGSGGSTPTPPSDRPRVIVSTDIGGCDADDYQSMVHYLVYADRFNTEALISSPPCDGRDDHILETLDAYEIDYPLLAEQGDFPSVDELRSITYQGATDSGAPGDGQDTEGSNRIIEQAMNDSPDPLFVLVWGSITDVAQAVYDDPSITDTIRVYSIGSWNTGQDNESRDYLYENHRDSLWWIENDTTFRGMYFDCGYGSDDPGDDFLRDHVNGHGALGDFLYNKKSGLKMGDTPSVLYLLHGDPSDPTGESWGGSFALEDEQYPTFWTDRQDEACGDKDGAFTVGKWRADYLRDWQERMDWVKQ